jgi:hypothetical protein
MAGGMGGSWPATVEHVDFSENRLSQTIPRSLLNLPELTYLNLGRNLFVGTVPFPPTANMTTTALDKYLVHDNPTLGGTLPSRFWALHLSDFDAHNTSLSGTIPKIITSTCVLKNVFMGHTQLSGFLPENLHLCSKLIRLHLNNAQLDGQLPPRLANCSSLQELNLRNNSFYGSLPEVWPAFRTQWPHWVDWDLQRLDLSYNQLSGTLPSQFIDLFHGRGRSGFIDILFKLNLAGNRLDLCGGLGNRTGGLGSSMECDVRYQTPVECGCPTFWTRCAKPTMSATCDPGLPPNPYVAPPFPGFSEPPAYEPSDDPPSGPPSPPNPTPASGPPSSSAPSSGSVLPMPGAFGSLLLLAIFGVVLHPILF